MNRRSLIAGIAASPLTLLPCAVNAEDAEEYSGMGRWPRSIIVIPPNEYRNGRIVTYWNDWDGKREVAHSDDYSFDDRIRFFQEGEWGLQAIEMTVREMLLTPRKGLTWIGRAL